jgi:hypothetical protein
MALANTTMCVLLPDLEEVDIPRFVSSDHKPYHVALTLENKRLSDHQLCGIFIP